MERSEITETILNFHCPRFNELSDMGLYMEQVLTLMNTVLAPVLSEKNTAAMISNYIKKNAVPAPVKKRYTREHLAYLVATTLLKQVFTLQQISAFFDIQRSTYPVSVAYDYFCAEYENALKNTFCFTGEAMPRLETRLTDQTVLVRAVVLAAANRVYAEKLYFT